MRFLLFIKYNDFGTKRVAIRQRLIKYFKLLDKIDLSLCGKYAIFRVAKEIWTCDSLIL